jgi:hypothetical protein
MATYPMLTSTNQPTTSITLEQLVIDVNQPGHTFIVGHAVYYDTATTQWELADSADDAKLATHLVTSSNVPLFSATTHGTVAWTHAHGAVGTKLYLDTGGNVGLLTATPPAGRKQWVAVVKDAASVIMVNLTEGVSGPVASTDTAVVKFSGTGGDVVSDTSVLIDATNKLVLSSTGLQLATGATAGKVLTSDATGNAAWALLATSRHVNVGEFAFSATPDYTAPNAYGSATWTGVSDTATLWFELPTGTTQLASFEVKYFSLAVLGTTLTADLLDRTATTVTTTAANVTINTTTTTNTEHLSTNQATAFTPSGTNVGQLGLRLGQTPANMHIMSIVLNFA